MRNYKPLLDIFDTPALLQFLSSVVWGFAIGVILFA